MKKAIGYVFLMSMTAALASADAAETRVLLKDPAKDTKGYYPASWEAQADYWQGGALVAGYDYLVQKGHTLRVPQTTTAGTYPFPGDSLTIQDATLAYTGSKEPAIVSFKNITFATNTVNYASKFAAWTSGTYFYYSNKGLPIVTGSFSVMDAKATVIGPMNMVCDSNLGTAVKWKGSLTGDKNATINVKGVDKPIACWGQALHFRLESDTETYLGKITVNRRATFITRGLENGSVEVNADGVLQPIEIADDAMTTKSLSLGAGAAIAIPVNGTTGANGSIKVTGSFSKSTGSPVIVTLTNSVVTTTDFIPPTKLKILTVPIAAALSSDDFVYYGVLTEIDAFLQARVPSTMGVFTVEENEAAGTKVLYLNLKRKVNNLVGQAKENYWDNAANWSDGKTPDADGDYYTNNKGFRMRGVSGETFAGHSLTLNGKSGTIQIRTNTKVNFPGVGLILEYGSLCNYSGNGTLQNKASTMINGNIFVISNPNTPVWFDPANNAFRGFNFPEGYTFSGPTNAFVVLKGSYCSTDDRRSCMQNEFNADTTDYRGTFDVRTNAVLVLGKYGLVNGTVHVTGGTYLPAAGAIAAMGPNTNAVVKNLKMLTNAGIEVRTDKNGSCGKLRVTDNYTQNGIVQVWLENYPKHSGTTVAPNYDYEILTVAKDAGDLDASKFTFAGVIEGGEKRIGQYAFKVVTDENGDQTLVLNTLPKGLMMLVR